MEVGFLFADVHSIVPNSIPLSYGCVCMTEYSHPILHDPVYGKDIERPFEPSVLGFCQSALRTRLSVHALN